MTTKSEQVKNMPKRPYVSRTHERILCLIYK